ncbi:MAG: DJ-1/PfpI family protein [Candidatus Micrarchaeota archaeon]|nr:DJ-1/PfpI family protein [Candidatus Micrarchaeota archaeon]
MEKKVLAIVAPKDFRDEELFVPKQYLEQNNVAVLVASTTKGIAKGKLGGQIKIDLTLSEVKIQDFDGVFFVGGPGTIIVRAEPNALNIAKEAYKAGKIIGAICWAPTILAKAGILKDKKATCWLGPDSEYGMQTDTVLEKFGSKFVNQPVVIDGKIITANGPAAAEEFAKKMLEAL